jgi:hypothetical protein
MRRADHVVARMHLAPQPRSSGIHASVSENGRLTRTFEPAIAIAITRPADVAAAREIDSPRRNQYRPSPATSGGSTRNNRMATLQLKRPYRSIGARYIQPACGSATKGVPAIVNGFHAGIAPLRSAVPRKQWFRRKTEGTSGLMFENLPPNK